MCAFCVKLRKTPKQTIQQKNKQKKTLYYSFGKFKKKREKIQFKPEKEKGV